MSYTDEIVMAKLSALNETQESIVTAAQWIMFHRRHADDTAQLWLEKIRSSNAPKKLNLVYLANEVVQQSKAREKEDFLIAFSPIIAEATALAYKGSPTDIQQKIRRVVEIWRQRRIFDEAIQGAIETRIDEIDRTKSTGKKPLLGGSLFTSSTPGGTSIPADLQPLVPLQLSSSKSSAASTSAVTAATAEYDKLYGTHAQIPTPPVYAARLSQLLKSLAHAENSVFESIKSRTALLAALEKLLDTNREALAREQAQAQTLTQRKEQTENKKREVEDAIMRGLATEPTVADAQQPGNGNAGVGAAADENAPKSPVVEALTPPPVEALTPLGSPNKQAQQAQQQPQDSSSRPPSFSLSNAPQGSGAPAPASAPTEAVPGLSNLLQVLGGGRPASSASGTANTAGAGAEGAESHTNTGKRRKISHNDDAGDEIARQFEAGSGNGNEGDAMAGLDEDVAELLRQESQKYPPAGQS